jgi:subtilisin family serine protease
LQANLTQMDVPGAQQFSTGARVRIAIIDTGIDAAHPDLAGRLIATRDFVDGEHGYTAEMHGTEVAGVIGALANNGIGIAGIAPDAELIGLRACWPGGADGHGICNSFTLAQAITAALDARASIINLSLSGPDDPLLTRLVERGQRQGAIFVGAVPPAGNRQGFPTGVAHVLAVDRLEHPAAATGVLLAPGTDVFTLTPQGHYDVASGSSIAAAEVSGVAALLLSVHPGLPADRLEGILSTTSQTAAGATRGAGGIDAAAAIKKLRQRLPTVRDDASTASGK